MPQAGDFELATVSVPEPGPGEVLVRNVYMSVDPYMRGRMYDRPSYVPPFQLGQPLEGGAVGRVIASNGGPFAVGDAVLGTQGWREHFVSDGRGLRKIDPEAAPMSAYLGALGMPGLTAYVGLLEIAALAPGETVFVSGAAGAVGSVACQIAKAMGCRVVASAGSAEKVAWLEREAGVDAAFDYKAAGPGTRGLVAALAERAPDGIDVYFDNVGGEHLEAALDRLNLRGRVALCGMIAQYNDAAPPTGPRNLALAIGKQLTLRGFIVSRFAREFTPRFVADMARWVGEGRMRWTETIVDGIDRAPEAFLGLFRGDNLGKMLVRVGPEA
jgi:hypothetical protein